MSVIRASHGDPDLERAIAASQLGRVLALERVRDQQRQAAREADRRELIEAGWLPPTQPQPNPKQPPADPPQTPAQPPANPDGSLMLSAEEVRILDAHFRAVGLTPPRPRRRPAAGRRDRERY